MCAYLVSAARASCVALSQISAKRQGWLLSPEGAQEAASRAVMSMSRETGASEYCRTLRLS